MPRLNLPLPEKVLFRTCITVQIGDINYGNHLANDAVLRLCHECRMRWLARHGFSELDAGGAGLIMADAAVLYLAQAHHGDELAVEMGAADIGRSGFALLYHIGRESDGRSIAKVQTGMVCFDYAAQKICRLPEGLGKILQAV
ncbi:acyl-CoA thioesterase [Neisseria dentiae]|uniref:acyl-CoA thioesterase n=2 Tax=Neisseria dentiae TaxID=194197 RepID=UPI0035A00432